MVEVLSHYNRTTPEFTGRLVGFAVHLVAQNSFGLTLTKFFFFSKQREVGTVGTTGQSVAHHPLRPARLYISSSRGKVADAASDEGELSD